VPKTAGKSVAQDLDVSKLVSVSAVRFRSPWCGRLSFGHLHYPTLCRAGHVPAHFQKSAFRFAFVRNSWDRLVSLYHYLQARGLGMHQRTSFATFLHLVRDHAFEPPGLFNAVGISQAASQLEWLRDDGREFAHFIGRYERLSNDLAVVAGELGCPQVRLQAWSNASKHGNYRDYYNAELRGIVAKVYEEEIERFEFQF
jgi:chondroitin 4-sulfotransferase 11